MVVVDDEMPWILTNALHRAANVEFDPGIVPVLESHFHARIEVD
jgi:hypothetical protein